MTEIEQEYAESDYGSPSIDADSFAEYDAAPEEGEPTWTDPYGQDWTQDEWVAQQHQLAELEQELAEFEQQQYAQPHQQQAYVDNLASLEQLAGNAALQTAQMEAFADVADEYWTAQMQQLAAQMGREAGVSDPRAIEQAAEAQLEAERDWWHRGLAQGHTPEEMAYAMQGDEFQQWRQEGLSGQVAAQKYLAVTANTAMGRHRARTEAQDRQAALLGEEPAPSIYESPSLQRMANRLTAQHEQREAQREALAAREQDMSFRHDVNRDAIEREHERRRFRKMRTG